MLKQARVSSATLGNSRLLQARNSVRTAWPELTLLHPALPSANRVPQVISQIVQSIESMKAYD
jgi:hypothetical protein